MIRCSEPEALLMTIVLNRGPPTAPRLIFSGKRGDSIICGADINRKPCYNRGMSREIALTKGGVALVDDEDYERVRAWIWRQSPDGYAVGYVGGGRGASHARMHRWILGLTPGQL